MLIGAITYMTTHCEKEESTIVTIIDPTHTHTLPKETKSH